MAVDGPRHPGVVDRDHRLAQDASDDHDPLGEADVGQLGCPATTSPTAHTPSAARAHGSVGDHEAPVVHHDPGPGGHQALGAGPAADRDHHGVDGELLAVVEVTTVPWPDGIRGVALEPRRPPSRRCPASGRSGPPTSTTSSSHPAEDARERLEDGDRGAEVAEHRGELAADGAAADHRHRRRAARRGPGPRRRSGPARRRCRSRGWSGAPIPAARTTSRPGDLGGRPSLPGHLRPGGRAGGCRYR